MFCRNCGAQLADSAKFCDSCGAQTVAEQANIFAQAEKNRAENPPSYLDLKTAIIITVMLLLILPGVCWFVEAPLVIGFAVAGVMGAFCLFMGIRNQFFKK